jgi:segregation and condensation protein A
VIQIAFPGFSGTPWELREALRRGRLSPKDLPVLQVVEQALSQVPEELKAKAELLPLLAELLVLKLAPEKALAPKEEGEEAPLVRVLLDLSEAVAFLEGRLVKRARLYPVSPPPVPRPSLRLPPRVLAEAARPPRAALGQVQVSYPDGRVRGGRIVVRLPCGYDPALPPLTWAAQVVPCDAEASMRLE